jgi:hypothetical protein
MKIKVTINDPKMTVTYNDVEDFRESEDFIKFTTSEADGSRFGVMIPIRNILLITTKAE